MTSGLHCCKQKYDNNRKNHSIKIERNTNQKRKGSRVVYFLFSKTIQNLKSTSIFDHKQLRTIPVPAQKNNIAQVEIC